MQQLDLAHNNFIRNGMTIDLHYRYERLADKHIDKVAHEFTKTFCLSEPMTHYLDMDQTLYKDFAYAVTKKAAKDNLSVVALDKENVIGFALVEDIADPVDIPAFDPKFNFILALLEKLGAGFFEGKHVEPHQIAHLFITAVDEKYRHRGISTQVNFQAMDLAAINGFDYMYCEFTNYYNEKGTIPHLNNKKRLIGSQIYKDFIIDNIRPFSHLPGGANAYLWEIK